MSSNKELSKALCFIQSNLKAAKTQTNMFGNYNYRSCEDILEAVKPYLSDSDYFVTVTDQVVLIGDRYYIKATASFGDNENFISVDGFAREAESKKGMDPAQLTGATSSYARKYALNGLFCIDDNKDADTQDNRVAAEVKTNIVIYDKAAPKTKLLESVKARAVKAIDDHSKDAVLKFLGIKSSAGLNKFTVDELTEALDGLNREFIL